MKRISFFLCLIVATATAQNKFSIDNIYEVYLRSSGPIIENKQVKGYFFLYISDKVDRKTNHYTLRILDQNLNSVKSIEFDDAKEVTLVESSYNGNNIAFLFRNDKEHKMDIRIYGIDGKLKYTYNREYDVRSSGLLNVQNFLGDAEKANKMLFEVGDNGFVGIYPVIEGMRKITYEVDFYSSTQQKKWTYIPQDDEPFANATFLGFTDKAVLLNAVTRSNTSSKAKVSNTITAINLDNNRKMFEINTVSDKMMILPSLVIKESENGVYTVAGLYVDEDAYESARSANSKQTHGIAFSSFNEKGVVLKRYFNSWQEGLSKYIKVNKNGILENFGYLMFQNLISYNGNLFVIGEGYDKKLVTDMIVIEVNSDRKISNAQIFPKTHNAVGNLDNSFMVSMETNATIAKMMGEFDYKFSNFGISGFSVVYEDFLRKNKKDDFAISVINYREGKFSTEKIKLSSKADLTEIYPAKLGFVMIVEYFKKEKKLDMRLEKMD